jgi:3-methylcrotonyl-CoA carboxylase alpha subunit
MFKKILIANRGEIACRVAATAKRMGIQTVAVYSDADAHAKHVAACDEAIHVGGSAPKDSYLRWEAIIEAAKATGAQAIHPGYGFLSENEAFADACAKAGLVFIGPPASAIQAMGLKAESKQLMEKAGVPLVPGYHGADQNPELLHREADRIGYPVLIKASAGGGGKGMRAVEKSEDFAEALASCQREAQNSFGDQAVLIEKYVQRPRHIEIQVFGDTQGNCVYLMERDCSVQRRHQKVLEEAPAPGMSEALRKQMGEAAVAAARAVNYVGAGTVEFIVEQRDNKSTGQIEMTFFFMEMNTRLQVEHPVTEAVTGLDLVEWQLRVASGEPLPLKQDQIKLTGHAIEARICAETPDNNFLPATGHLQVYKKPAHTAFERGTVRFDDGVRQGDTISPYYDSMVAKLIVHGDTRDQALALLDQALAQTQVVGLSTNVQFLRHVVHSASFAEARLDTALIPREADVLFNQEKVGLNVAAAAVVAHTLHQENAKQGHDPFSKSDGWQSHAETTRRFPLEFAGETHTAWLHYGHNGAMQLTWGDAAGPAAKGPQDEFSFAVRRSKPRNRPPHIPITERHMARPARDQRSGSARWQTRSARRVGARVHSSRCYAHSNRSPFGPCRRCARRKGPSYSAHAWQGGFLCCEGGRQGQGWAKPGRHGGHENGTHHCSPQRWRSDRVAVCAGRSNCRGSRVAQACVNYTL